MTRFLGKFSEPIYALLRIFAGYIFMLHGAQKLFGVLGGEQQALASLPGVAGLIEFFGGLLILLGLFASWAAFIASGEMAVAYFIAHVPQGPVWNPLPNGGNGGEAAVLYCFVFLFVAAKGAGKWSVASALSKPSLQ